MCHYYYLHHHHMPPCTRDIDMVVHYVFCPYATTDASGSVPCANLEFDSSQNVDYTDPCAMGGCLASPDCSSGKCRLEELNGCWVCCQCKRGGNQSLWCRHRMRGSPDTFCYHTCCESCQPDFKKR
ncbi:hypothetical protein QBC47DRAFT_173604 [Echria macrotheca]|uniref:Uncharacterized protein n=1 Tax=Echria macrotheca TaxID=438768 RepID=A0AAJ0BGT3_9PEZI|nr:hypothetical protein QBC47DRAFT_173604 [Echria macrotheca]